MSGLFELATPRAGGYRDVDPGLVARYADRVHVVDVREPAEIEGELGRLRGAELVPLGRLGEAAARWPKDAEIVLVCRSGARSSRGAALLASMGFGRAMNMAGGMLAYGAAGLPTTR
jgi:rhodanese-related sulfurtransferase